jgi:hypothetical protein
MSNLGLPNLLSSRFFLYSSSMAPDNQQARLRSRLKNDHIEQISQNHIANLFASGL